MTVNDLIARLQALTPEQREFDARYWDRYWGESVEVGPIDVDDDQREVVLNEER